MNRTMKKEYMQPGIEVLDIQLQPVMIIISGENIKSDETADTSSEDNRSRQRTYNAWGDEEEEEEY